MPEQLTPSGSMIASRLLEVFQGGTPAADSVTTTLVETGLLTSEHIVTEAGKTALERVFPWLI